MTAESATAPRTLLLGRYDDADVLRYTGRTVPLARTATAALAETLTPATSEHPWSGRTFTAGWGSRDVLDVTLVDPQLVVEVDVESPATPPAAGATPYASTGRAWTCPRTACRRSALELPALRGGRRWLWAGFGRMAYY
ncbi:hypothetical protein [Streptomyces griseicoloratus]|uniref:hypothetical protein n=1 Tax=Streptomyces griseicoloratus TaxID=2752516 RepID=UPI001CB6F887|nr:hypothetical protein [Streptomyces griseicoloratus]